MKKKLFLQFALIVYWIGMLVSCASVKGFEGTSDLCGIVTDSSNKPIVGYRLKLVGKNGIQNEVVSNESGIFVFKNVKKGKYKIFGDGKNWSKVLGQEVDFFNRSVITCIQIQSFDELLFEFEQSLLRKDYAYSLEVLKSISDEDATSMEIEFYMALANFKIGNLENALKLLGDMQKKPEIKELGGSCENPIAILYEKVQTELTRKKVK